MTASGVRGLTILPDRPLQPANHSPPRPTPLASCRNGSEKLGLLQQKLKPYLKLNQISSRSPHLL